MKDMVIDILVFGVAFGVGLLASAVLLPAFVRVLVAVL